MLSHIKHVAYSRYAPTRSGPCVVASSGTSAPASLLHGHTALHLRILRGALITWSKSDSVLFCSLAPAVAYIAISPSRMDSAATRMRHQLAAYLLPIDFTNTSSLDRAFPPLVQGMDFSTVHVREILSSPLARQQSCQCASKLPKCVPVTTRSAISADFLSSSNSSLDEHTALDCSVLFHFSVQHSERCLPSVELRLDLVSTWSSRSLHRLRRIFTMLTSDFFSEAQ